jgi:hypothetical protein
MEQTAIVFTAPEGAEKIEGVIFPKESPWRKERDQ